MPGKSGELGNLIPGKFSDLEGNFALQNKEKHKKLQGNVAFLVGNLTHIPGKYTKVSKIPSIPQPALQVYGDPINHVSDFRYLGSMVASGSSDLKRRKSLTWCAFWKLEQL